MSPQPRPEMPRPEEFRPEAGRTGARDSGGSGDSRVTVAVITRDRPAGVLRTVDALTALPERPPVIVVDNSSGDSALQALRHHHPSAVRVLRPGRNTGALGRNLAVRQADTPYVAFSDDDSWWTQGSLRQAADLLDRHPRLGLLAARTLVGPERAEDPLNAVLAASPLPREADLPGRPVLGFLACACVVRRDAYLAAGGFHPLLFFGGEETLLAYDLTARGWGVTYDPSLTARHCPAPGGRGGRGHLLRRNEVLTLWLRRPLPVALRATARLGAAATAGDPHARRALREVVVRLPAALARRRPLPPHVEAASRLLERQKRR
ncbi:glycosyltransferase family 2 protein [Streptomyces sp. NPDC048523]|uniref:glycosyltransferase family 2 protein n=1 Tax=Streptomyces sp. NPDC048523 TaxID=3365567 RepID=UPI00371F916C